MEKVIQKSTVVFRWIMAILLPYFAARLLIYIGARIVAVAIPDMYNNQGMMYQIYENVVMPAVMAMTAYYVAPKFNKIFGYVWSLLWAAFLIGVTIYGVVYSLSVGRADLLILWDSIQLYITNAIGVFASLALCAEIKRLDEKQNEIETKKDPATIK